MAGVSACNTDKSRSLAVDQESGWTVGNVLFCALICTSCRHYSVNLNKRENRKQNVFTNFVTALRKHVYSTYVKHFSVYSAMKFCVHRVVQCRKCLTNVPSIAK